MSVAYYQGGVFGCLWHINGARLCVCCLLPRGRVVVLAANNQEGVLVCLWPIGRGVCVCVCVSVAYGQGGVNLSICLWEARRGRPMCSPDAANAGVIYLNPLLMRHVNVCA